jgi:short-subunit dehydrogenase
MTDLKPLSQQAIVLTGATSGIGLATARRLAGEGARLALVARNTEALEALVHEIQEAGGTAIMLPGDVADRDRMREIAREASDRLGSLDTWVNDAGVAVYGAVTDVPFEDQRRLFETNYWGVVAGSLAAIEQFRRQRSHGKIVNVGSVLSDRTMIYQGPYSASKHAVKAFTDALRMELDAAGEPISVTLIKPSAIDTPYMEHADSHLDTTGTKNPPPSYTADVVAKAIAHAAVHDKRDLIVGGAGHAIALTHKIAPALTDAAMMMLGKSLQTSKTPPRRGMRDNVHQPRRDLAERSAMAEPSPRRSSLYLEGQMHPRAAVGALALVGLLVAAGARGAARR